ncbi:acyltransferase family protein [Rossellomorea aquimaris]|uniref:Membrane-bound acyltransferase YfiQ involved in biofilm formation n=1 Tax=Rossellomorea aquimaris TaxID=189382 RepID=A0A366ENT6_9BACI|nr:acyltransferase family protein [Rossellomorea aquimaris]RBP03135.1 membrane-bound acyltransferase YfiQ involved in biofilm formation [Rossellomorea aquimaris]
MSKHIVKEIFLLRGLACLAVVIIHSINSVFANYGIRKVPEYMEINNILFVIQILLMFGTPMFVFISEFILANSYKNKVPKGFFVKRFKYILIPYLIIGILSSLIVTLQNKTFSIEFFLTTLYQQFILGYFHGYFVIIIFQFYFLHILFKKYVEGRFSTKVVIAFSILVNFSYLTYFNFIEPSPKFPFHLLFFAWIGYFTLAFYCGGNLDRFKIELNKYKGLVLSSPAFTSLIVLILCYSGSLTYIQSKRIDIIFYTITLAFFFFYIGMKLKEIPNFLVKISQYSFGIYLLHPFFQLIIEKLFTNNYSITNLVSYILVATFIGIFGPIVCTILLNKYEFGSYIIGKIGIGINNKKLRNISNNTELKKSII